MVDPLRSISRTAMRRRVQTVQLLTGADFCRRSLSLDLQHSHVLVSRQAQALAQATQTLLQDLSRLLLERMLRRKRVLQKVRDLMWDLQMLLVYKVQDNLA